MHKRLLLLATMVVALALTAAPPKPAWIHIPSTLSKHTQVKVNSYSPSEFDLTLATTPENPGGVSVQMVRTINASHHSQRKLFFQARCPDGGAVQVHLIITTAGANGKIVTHFGPRITISGKEFTRHLFGLDNAFGMLDQEYRIWQVKPYIGRSNMKPGQQAQVEFRDFQIDSMENLGTQSDQPLVTVFPPEHKRPAPRPDALKIYFHLDNDDYKKMTVKDRVDPVIYRGYRDMLLDTVREHATIVETPEEAEVIVYSAAKSDAEMAQRIAHAVALGKPLYVSANVPDSAIAALLPVEITLREYPAFPERHPIRATSPQDQEFRELSTAKFAIYRNLKLKDGAKTLLEHTNGSPIVVQKGKVIYNAQGLGVGLIQEKDAIDPFMLRMLARLTGKALPEKALPPVNKDGEYQEGVSFENIGRVGYALGDGLLCETMGNSLNVSSGAGQYEFRDEASPKIRLANWHIRSISGSPAESEKDVSWNYRYGQIGVVELTTQTVIPEAWRGKVVHFVVEKGIDDTAKVYFNDTFLGEVTQKMPRYWDRPHRYRLPAEAIRYGQPNTLKVVTENIRESGGFGSCPEILPAGVRRPELNVHVDRANPLGKGGVVKNDKDEILYRFDTSLAFPGIRWFFQRDFTFLSLGNIAAQAAVFTNGEVRRITPESTDNVLKCRWDKPVVLLYPKEKGTPLALVFSRQPDELTFDFSGGELSGISIRRKDGIGMILPLWIEGSQQISTVGWDKELPQELIKKLDFWLPKAYAYPVSFREFFRIAEEAKRVRIRTSYQYTVTPNDWNIQPQHYAPVSPLAYYSKDLGLFHSDQVENWNLATAFGWYAARPNNNTVEWSLPLPEEYLPTFPRVDADPAITDTLNHVYKQAARFIGGGRPVSTATFVHPFKPGWTDGVNMALHMWLHGMPDTAAAPFALTPENLQHFQARMAYRLMMPVEQYAYKSAAAWRQEPYSGLRYPVCFYSPRVHFTNFAPGTGSNFNICDANESVYMITTVTCTAAEQMGQREFILANPRWYRWFTKLIFSGDDPVTLTGHCGESGQPASIDMLNCEYAGMMNVARIAQILGDKDWRDQALYRAARRKVATLTRFTFKHYVHQTNQALIQPAKVYGTGYTESGYEYRFGIVSRNASYHVYDMSQGIPPRLFDLYDRYVPKEQEEYLQGFVLPSLYDKNGVYKHDHKLMNVACRTTTHSPEEKMQILRDCLANQRLINGLCRDYPGIGLVSNVTMALQNIYHGVQAHDTRDLEIRSFQYNPHSKVIQAEIMAGKAPRLILKSRLKPVKPAYPCQEDGTFNVPITPGKVNRINIQLQ